MGLDAAEQEAFDRVQEAFYADETLVGSFEAFADAHCEYFTDDDEQKLVYQEIYMQFQNEFEASLSALVESTGIASATFGELCAKLSEGKRSDDDEARWHFLSLISALSDYDMFLMVMLQAKENRKTAGEDAGAMGL